MRKLNKYIKNSIYSILIFRLQTSSCYYIYYNGKIILFSKFIKDIYFSFWNLDLYLYVFNVFNTPINLIGLIIIIHP